MTTRTAVLFDERGNPVGQTSVSEAIMLIRHGEALYVRRVDKGVRLAGGSIGAVFLEAEPSERGKLAPAGPVRF